MTVEDCTAFLCSMLFVTSSHGLCTAVSPLQLRTEPGADDGDSGSGRMNERSWWECPLQVTDRDGETFHKRRRKQQLCDTSCHWQAGLEKLYDILENRTKSSPQGGGFTVRGHCKG